MLKLVLFMVFFTFGMQYHLSAQPNYKPTVGNLKNRQWFKDAKYGMFIHWGLYSMLGDGEWVMNDRKITVKNYSRLENFFYPMHFDAKKWVTLAKTSGIKYITLVTRHHDGFSMWPTQYSDFHIGNTPFKRDIVKELADECHKQGIKIFFYYSLLDWRRDDYSYWTGRTGQNTGRTTHGDWLNYIQFMKNQLTELLTKYGEIGGIWFDGYWDQMDAESKDRKEHEVRLDWHINELYTLIHQLQPDCLVGNNHHISPLPGEDFQMFEQSVPNENTSGLNFQKVSKLPLETCATMNKSWGFNITDTSYKSLKEIVYFLVKSAGSGGNLLLNIGPMPDGSIQEEFVNTLHDTKKWLNTFQESIYNTEGGYITPTKWGAITQKGNVTYLHVLDTTSSNEIVLAQFPKKITKAYLLKNNKEVKWFSNSNGIRIQVPEKPTNDDPDVVIVLQTK